MATQGPTINKPAARQSPAGTMSARARHIIAATVTNLGTGAALCTKTFPARADQVAQLRTVIKDTLTDHPACDTVVLLASELAGNAIRYSGSRFFAFTIARTHHGGLHAAIIDEGRTGFPHLKNEAADAEQGRGMKIVDALAERWGIIRHADIGVAVWFECTH